ncbi:MAG TPA: iron ABC transporter permease [Desulfotomaculum sp.]|nr:iron ABC transporter permease [Desulfotomaculum sp.]
MNKAGYEPAGLGRVRTSNRTWPLSWNNINIPMGIAILSSGAGILAFLPAAMVIFSASNGTYEMYVRLIKTKVPVLFVNTLGLMVAVTVVAAIIAVFLAFIVSRTDFPGKRLLHFILVIPLAIPPYIGSFAYISLIGPAGAGPKIFKSLGWPVDYIPSVYSFGGATLILSLCTFPYIYLLVKPALSAMTGRWEEVGRSCGYTSWQVFWKVTLPLVRPALGAGCLLVGLYVLSDFGAVTMLRMQTFTGAIYLQLIGRYDKTAASVLALALIAVTFLLIYFEQKMRGKSKYYQFGSSYTEAVEVVLGKWRYPVMAVVITILLLSVGIPMGMLLYWTAVGIGEGALDPYFWGYAYNSIISAVVAATATIIPAVAIAYVNTRHRGIFSSIVNGMANSSYALPGVVVALGFILLTNKIAPVFYGTIWVLLVAYAVRFLPQSIQAGNSAIEQVPPQLEEAGRLAGYSVAGVFYRVIIPLIRPGLLAGWALAFLGVIKELPVTLLLRPVGFDTLPVRVWIEASEGFFYLGAPGALLMVVLSLFSITLITNNRG